MKFVKAVKDKIVVEKIMQDTVTEGGIIIPVSVDKDPQSFGKVISVGEEITTIQPGDIVVFHKNFGMDIMIDRRIMRVLVYNEIFGILEDVDTPQVPGTEDDLDEDDEMAFEDGY